MNLASRILRWAGWTVEYTVPDFPKCIICVAPHTSNWDFILGELAIHSVGRSAGFLMKSSWFFFPLGALFRSLGGIPVERAHKKQSLSDLLIQKFRSSERLTLAITPEGTRKRVANWHTGFLRIAFEAGIPIVLGAIDFPSKHITVTEVFTPTGDIQADMKSIKAYYRPYTGKHPDQFTTEDA